MSLHTYRIRIANASKVYGRKEDSEGRLLSEPDGQLTFKGKAKSRIQELTQKAQVEISADEIKELGTLLFGVLFDQRLGADFLLFYEEIVQKQKSLLRIELDVDESELPEIAALPWEFTCAPSSQLSGELWLATAPRLIFSRRRALWNPASPVQLKPNEKLRIAIAVSAPQQPAPGEEKALGKVSYTQLWDELQALQTSQADRVELLPLVYPATREAIDDILKQEPHIFHFIGHGRLRDQAGQEVGQIAITDDLDRPRWVTATQFSTFFGRHRPSIALLQACEGGALSATQAFVGVASQLVQQNIPVVVAMQHEITNVDARRFAREFYQALARDEPVDQAVQEGRLRIADFHESRAFATPVLFMRAAQGRIFARADEPPDSHPAIRDAGSGTAAEKLPPATLTRIRDNFSERFSLSDLRMLCFDMGIDYDDFPSAKQEFIIALIRYCEHNGRTDELLAQGRAARSFLDWSR